jgi:hypothetical protein
MKGLMSLYDQAHVPMEIATEKGAENDALENKKNHKKYLPQRNK